MLLIEITKLQVPRLLYHITLRENLPSIKQHGIKPGESKWSKVMYSDNTFLTTKLTKEVVNEILRMLSNKHGETPEDHESWSTEDWDNFQNSYIALVIDTLKVPNLQLESDPNLREWHHSVITSTTIPPEAIIDTKSVRFDWS